MGTIEPQPWKKKKICPCCNGKGWQYNGEGLRVKCPCCNGSGRADIGMDDIDETWYFYPKGTGGRVSE